MKRRRIGRQRVVVGLLVAAVGVLGVLPASASAADVDSTPPVLHGASFSTSAMTAPGTMTLNVDAADDVGIVRSDVRFFEDLSHRTLLVVDTESPLTAQVDVDSTTANGRWRVYSIRLADAAGNYSYYKFDGLFLTSASPVRSTHDVDLTGIGLTLSGATDESAPVLTRMAVSTKAVRAGEPTTYIWAATDGEHAVSGIRATFKNPVTGEFATAEDFRASAGSGTLTLIAPHVGEWPLVGVELIDGLGNLAYYRPDGKADVPGGMFPRTHDLSLAGLGVAVAPRAAEPSVVERPGRLSVVLPASVRPQLLSGVRVTARPSGVVRDVPVPTGDRAVVDVTGLPNGVAQTLTITLHSAWGDSPAVTVTGRPVLSRNVTGTANVTAEGKPDDEDGVVDLFAMRQSGLGQDDAVLVYPGTGTGGVRQGQVWLPREAEGCEQIAAFDHPWAGNGELLCRTDALSAVFGGRSSLLLGRRGWGSMRWVDGGFDLNGDRTADVIAVDPAGDLRVYAQTSKGALVAWPRIGTGWQSMISVISAGDLTGDRKNDIAAVDSSGRLWLYPGNGKGGVTARKQIGAGWHQMGALLPLRDFDGDGRTDLGGITPGGDLRLYRGTGTGGVRGGVVIGTGWDRYL